MRFFRSKRDVALQALDTDFEDVRNDRLFEDMYSQDDVSDILESLNNMVKGNMRQELATTVNMTVLLLKQLFEGADEQGVHLSMDTGIVEDESLLKEVESMRLDVPAAVKRSGTGKLTSIKDEHQRLVDETGRLGETNKQLQDRFTQLQAQCSKILQEKSALSQEVSFLRQQLSMQEESKSQAKDTDISADLQNELSSLKAELSEANAAQDRRVMETRQFQQLRGMLSQRNSQLSDLRRRLAKYENMDDDNDAIIEDDDDEPGHK